MAILQSFIQEIEETKRSGREKKRGGVEEGQVKDCYIIRVDVKCVRTVYIPQCPAAFGQQGYERRMMFHGQNFEFRSEIE